MLKFPLHARGERVYLVHPGLADEPFVEEVERRLGERPVYDDCMAGVRGTFEHHHALDLCRRIATGFCSTACT